MNCLSSMQIFNSFQFHLAYDLSQLFFEWPGMDFQLSWYIIYDQLSGFQVPFPYTISFPNGQNARVANIIQRILPIVLMITHPLKVLWKSDQHDFFDFPASFTAESQASIHLDLQWNRFPSLHFRSKYIPSLCASYTLPHNPLPWMPGGIHIHPDYMAVDDL